MNHGHKVLIAALVMVALAVTLALIAAGSQGVLAAPGIIYVDAGATGANSGSSWEDAFRTLQPALDAAGIGDQIWVAAGTYKPTAEYGGTGNRFKSFRMVNGVAIYGGFDPDVGDVAWGHRNWASNLTILSGDRGTAEDGSDDSYHVFYHPARTVDSSAILDGFIITGGNAKAEGDASPHQNGGGMYNDNSSPTLNNITFSGNSAVDGGGMFNGAGSAPVLTNCTFEGNEADGGGGIYNLESAPTLSYVTFAGNSAANGGGMYNSTGALPTLTYCAFEGNEAGSDGGAMYNLESSPVLSSVTFKGNSAYYGGGMYNLESSPVLSSVTFKGNSAYYGGGMHNESSAPALSSVTFVDNSAISCGGGMCNESSAPTLVDCTFKSNEAGIGGGMYNYNSSPVLINCTFEGNAARGGGGLANHFSSPALTGCTFVGNSALYDGGGMYNDNFSWPTLANCTFTGNSAGQDGGGIFNTRQSRPTLTNCILASNSANRYGGGMYNGRGSGSTFTNSTFSGNEAPLGGGVFIDYFLEPGFPFPLVLINCILWGDTNHEIYDLGHYPYLYVTYNDIQGGYEGEGNIGLDPRFVDPDGEDFHLAPDSPCIDAGSNEAPSLPEVDFEGDARILDGDGDGTSIVDMGVDEFVPEVPSGVEVDIAP